MPRRTSSRTNPYAGATAIVTGGASGIGRALGARLAELGANVVLADQHGDAARVAALEIASAGSSFVEGRQLDVRELGAFTELVDDVARRTGAIDYLFNNAGVSIGGPTHEMTEEHWRLVLDVNLCGVINGVLAVYPKMVERRWGHIVNTASAAGLVAPPMVAGYATTKFAVVGLSTGLRPEAALHDVKVSVICPGMVETPILDAPPAAGLPPTPSAAVSAREYLTLARQKPMPADRFARKALDEVAKDRSIIVVPRSAATFWYLNRVSPGLVQRVGRTIARQVDKRLIRERPST